jgi:uncharacterized tellurite resistance protein B-like protein
MFIRKLLGLEPREASGREADTQTVRRIVQELEAMEPEKARYLAAFAFILSRVAHADSHVSAEETQEMERTVERWGGISAAQAILVVEIAKAQSSLFGATEDFLVTRQFKSMSTPVQREQLLHCLFAVSAADDSISSLEETLIRQIAAELDVVDREFIAIRCSYNDKRAVLKDFPGETGSTS